VVLGHGVNYSQNQSEKFPLPNDFLWLKNEDGEIVDRLDLSYYEFLGVPQAWQLTTGKPSVLIGISDAAVDPDQTDFRGKTRVLKSTDFKNGHGMGVAAIAAAQGDNNFGIPGVCYDCGLVTTNYGNPNLEMLLELADAGAKVINCSWVSSVGTKRGQEVVDLLLKRGVVIVAGAGNQNWATNGGQKLYYPASYHGVISVSSGMYLHSDWQKALKRENNGKPYVENLRGLVGRTAEINLDQPEPDFRIYPQSTATLNKEVDLLAPTVGVMRYSKWVSDQTLIYNTYQGTSTAAPFVTGTIGLMFSLEPALRANEVETILKLTAMNVDEVPGNAPYQGHYGAGMLQSAAAVDLVKGLYDSQGDAMLSKQKFKRWQQSLTAFNHRVRLKNIEFTDKAEFTLQAKRQIVLMPGTRIAPDKGGYIHLSIDPNLEVEGSAP